MEQENNFEEDIEMEMEMEIGPDEPRDELNDKVLMGRRIVDINHLVKEFKRMSHHGNGFDCY